VRFRPRPRPIPPLRRFAPPSPGLPPETAVPDAHLPPQEPALTAPRLALLLSSLTSLSALHTTSSSSAAAAKSIWHHDPATAIDPLAALEVDETGEAWGKAAVGGAGDVEAGAEGVALDESKQGVAAGEGMEVDQ